MISKRYSPTWLRLLLHPPIIHDEQVRLQIALQDAVVLLHPKIPR